MSELRFTDAYEIANFIKEAEKETPVKAYINGDISQMSTNNVKTFGNLV
ncbi:MAG: 2,3,4,5-tetrahydropyridine-2,6-dicarboxylate N-acetyltransferase, partial [Tetragenococcus halophilus]|nr:2,3,4,5-tetrahydropyridine-2,6-dicarboxylate N-acetyltransferase [Tetragenococcus halophilus]